MNTEKIPDYADIQRMENIMWSQDATGRKYARVYHELATEYGEDMVIDLIAQYWRGNKW